MKYHICCPVLLTAGMLCFSGMPVSAGNQYKLGETVSTGNDTGYSEKLPITAKDPHYGWELGKFFVSEYTRTSADENGNLLFLKDAGEQLPLYFRLEQNINQLNGNSALSVADDWAGYDQIFQVGKQEFGRGALIVRYTDYQNQTETKVMTDYLVNTVSGTDSEVLLCEEGDYEIALDYQIKNNPYQIGGFDILPVYTSYTVRFQFSVRNGNTAAFLEDAETGEPLTDTIFAGNGFYINTEKSHYLDIDIQREVFSDNNASSEIFTSPAKEGEVYTEEGIYTVTVRNPYTESEPAVKMLYVGSDPMIKAYLLSDYSLSELRALVAEGAEIDDDGTVILPTETETESETETETETETESETLPETESLSEIITEPESLPEETEMPSGTVQINESVTEQTGLKKTLPVILGISAAVVLAAVAAIKFLMK